MDESAFYLLPGVVRTWAPVGETPLLRCKLTRDHYSVISAITPTGELYLAMQTAPYDSVAVIAFLEQLQSAIEGKFSLSGTAPPFIAVRLSKTFWPLAPPHGFGWNAFQAMHRT